MSHRMCRDCGTSWDDNYEFGNPSDNVMDCPMCKPKETDLTEVKNLLCSLLEDGSFYVSAIEINTHTSMHDGEHYKEWIEQILDRI